VTEREEREEGEQPGPSQAIPEEPPASRPEEPGGEAMRREEVVRLEAEVERLSREREEWADLARRLRADFDQFRRRTREEALELRRTAAVDLLRELLPVLDNLERALAAPAAEDGGEALRQGVVLTRDQLFAVLAAAGLEPIPAVGRPFDPELHEALERVEGDGETGPEGGFAGELVIVEEFRRGYLGRGKLLRPSLVKVAPKVWRD
jgi:molecular chaperone GrpE